MNYADYRSPIGTIRIFAEDGCITGLYLQSQERPDYADLESKTDTVIQLATQWLDVYFDGSAPNPNTLPLRPIGTEFQQRVWDMLLQISYGQTVTYGYLAKQLGDSMSAQAVGQAVGKNPISIIIPCHRVLGTQNRLSGYAGGLQYKAWLLKHEGIDIADYHYPKKFRGK